eukprot:6476855-Amphidinium_carterae.1
MEHSSEKDAGKEQKRGQATSYRVWSRKRFGLCVALSLDLQNPQKIPDKKEVKQIGQIIVVFWGE